MPLNHEENNLYNEQKICHIYEEKFCTDKDDKDYINRKKVKDHCHYTGKFRGAAHSKCNLNYNVQKEIPIIIHNASYDTHFMLNQLAIEFKGELNCLTIIWKNISLFLYELKKKLLIIMVIKKQLHTNSNLLIVLDLCQIYYQNLLITHLKFLKVKNLNHV